MCSIKHRSIDELNDRIEQLEAWEELNQSTWGNANYSERYAELRESVFGTNDDPDDPWNDAWAINDEIVNRSKTNA